MKAGIKLLIVFIYEFDARMDVQIYLQSYLTWLILFV